MDDVLSHLMVAIGNENLLAGNPVMVALFDRLGPDRAEVRAGIGLGQVHRPRPFASDQLGQVLGLLRSGPAFGDGVDGAFVARLKK